MSSSSETTDNANNGNNNQEPFRVGTTKDSRDRVSTTLAAFSRFQKNTAAAPPDGLVQGLQQHVLEPVLENFQLLEHHHDKNSSSFQLRRQSRADSSRATQIYEFTVVNDNILTLRYVRKSDNDGHTLDCRTGELKSRVQHWMSGDRDSTSTFDDLPPTIVSSGDARSLLLDHWVAPQTWLKQGRAVIVRPSDARTALPESSCVNGNTGFQTVSSSGVVLCAAAVQALTDGFTLMLVVGDLVCSELPLRRGKRANMLFAGMMWKDGKPQQTIEAHHTEMKRKVSSATGKKTKNRRRPDELSFIIAEEAVRREQFTGKQAGQDSTKFQSNMFLWRPHDIYKYIPGTWC